jgi:hypothetical protein
MKESQKRGVILPTQSEAFSIHGPIMSEGASICLKMLVGIDMKRIIP